MARPRKRSAKATTTTRISPKSRDVKIERYRSQVLDKIRSDIALKRAAIDIVKKVSIPDLGNMGYWKAKYWKMKYWKMKYWKAGADMISVDEVINPATTIIAEAGARAGKKRVR